MSLINEALKKAQRQRMEGPATSPAPVAPAGSVPPMSIAKRRPPMPARTLVILLVGGASVLFMGGVLAFLFFGDNATPAKANPPVIAAKPVANTPPAPAPAQVLEPVPSTPVVTVKLPVVTPSVPAPAPVPTPVPTPSPAPVAVAKPEPTKPAPLAPSGPTANPRVYEFLETLRIAGIRVSATDPKVIMNDRVFRLNDIVDRSTQLRLLRIDSSVLTFVDATGFEYKKSF